MHICVVSSQRTGFLLCSTRGNIWLPPPPLWRPCAGGDRFQLICFHTCDNKQTPKPEFQSCRTHTRCCGGARTGAKGGEEAEGIVGRKQTDHSRQKKERRRLPLPLPVSVRARGPRSTQRIKPTSERRREDETHGRERERERKRRCVAVDDPSVRTRSTRRKEPNAGRRHMTHTHLEWR